MQRATKWGHNDNLNCNREREGEKHNQSKNWRKLKPERKQNGETMKRGRCGGGVVGAVRYAATRRASFDSYTVLILFFLFLQNYPFRLS